MKVIEGKHDIDFDNGLWIDGIGINDCCAVNYLDCEQFTLGTEFDDMNLEQLEKAMNIKTDGFALKDINGIPKWVQARSDQNGYYSTMTAVIIGDKKKQKELDRLYGEIST